MSKPIIPVKYTTLGGNPFSRCREGRWPDLPYPYTGWGQAARSSCASALDMTSDRLIARRVVARFVGAKPYVKDKETKEHKVDKLADKIRDATGLSKGMSESIADAIVRGREVLRLAIQKNWPISEDGVIEGPKGTLDLAKATP